MFMISSKNRKMKPYRQNGFVADGLTIYANDYTTAYAVALKICAAKGFAKPFGLIQKKDV